MAALTVIGSALLGAVVGGVIFVFGFFLAFSWWERKQERNGEAKG